MESRLIPATAEVSVLGKTYTIKPFGFGQYPKVAKALTTVLPLFEAEGNVVSLADLIETGGEAILGVMALAIKEERAFFDDVTDPQEGIDLLKAIIEVNRPSFEKKLLPALAKLLPTPAQPESAE